jgi:hypothetical protein
VNKKTLPESGIASISRGRTDVTGTNQGHASGYDFLGFQGGFTRANGTTGIAETIYFATDRKNLLPGLELGFVPTWCGRHLDLGLKLKVSVADVFSWTLQ